MLLERRVDVLRTSAKIGAVGGRACQPSTKEFEISMLKFDNTGAFAGGKAKKTSFMTQAAREKDLQLSITFLSAK